MSAGETITLQQATDWCANFRTEYPSATRAYLFDKSIIGTVLNQSGCEGIRIYNAIDGDEESCVVIVGVDSTGDDMTAGYILERGDKCPPTCPSDSPLNEDE